MASRQQILEEVATEVTKALTDRGKLIEAGFVAFKHLTLQRASQAQIDVMRIAWMGGADHLFSSIMDILDPGEEPTDKDLKRMDLIEKELAEFRTELLLRLRRAKGTA